MYFILMKEDVHKILYGGIKVYRSTIPIKTAEYVVNVDRTFILGKFR